TACLKRSNSAQCSSCRLLNNARRGLCRATASLCALPCPSRRITCCPDARKQMDEATEAKRPALSIIIPTLNEAHSIGATLDALLAVRGHIELIVVDGGSHDGTIEILRARGVRVIESEQGRGVQMHAGVCAARGAVLWFLHADTIAPMDAAERISEALRKAEVVGGNFCVRFDGARPAARFLTWLYPQLRKLGLCYGD